MGRALSNLDKKVGIGERLELCRQTGGKLGRALSTVDKMVGIGERLEPCRHLVGVGERQASGRKETPYSLF